MPGIGEVAHMMYVVYISFAKCLMSEKDLDGMLETFREYNAPRNITGLLLYKDGVFIQALEGPETEVQGLYAKIQTDPRHENVTALLQGSMQGRLFPHWAMGFQNICKMTRKQLLSISSFFDSPLDIEQLREDPNRIYAALIAFRDNLESQQTAAPAKKNRVA
jgi:hypothetical protein